MLNKLRSRYFPGRKKGKSSLRKRGGLRFKRKALIVSLFFLIFFTAYLTANYNPDIDWDYPHEECSNGDWRSEKYVVYIDGNMGENPIFSPFYWDSQPNLTPIANEDDSDFQPEDGWNLLAVEFGQPGGVATAEPYLALYNKYLGKIRVFIMNTDVTVSYYATSFGITYGGESSLIAHASENRFLRAADKRDEEDGNEYSLANPEQGDYGWYYADFDVMYDPYPRDYDDGELAVYFRGYDVSNVDLDFVSDHLSTSSENSSPGFDPLEFGNMVNSHWKDAGTWIDNLDDIANGNVSWFDDYDSTFMENIIDGTSSIAQELQATGFTAILPYANTIFGIANYFTGGGGSKSVISSLVEDVQISGTISQMSTETQFSFFEPITGQIDISNNKALDPVYPYTLGTFNLETTPIMEYRECEFTYYNQQGQSVDIPYHSYRIQDELDYIINPDCGINTEVADMQIAIQGVFDLEDSPMTQTDKAALMTHFFNWADDGFYSVIAKKGDYWYIGPYIFQTEFIDYEDIKHTVINAPDFTEFTTKVKSVLEVEDNPNQEPILFMADYLPDTELVSGDDPFPYTPEQQIEVIYADTTFDENSLTLEHNIIVSPGVTLTLDNCDLSIGDSYKIEVNNGTILLQNNSKLVVGDNAFLELSGGEIYAENDSEIENNNVISLSGRSLVNVSDGSILDLEPGSCLYGTDHTVYDDPATGQRYNSYAEAYQNFQVGAEDEIPGDRIVVNGSGTLQILSECGDERITISSSGDDNTWDGIYLEDAWQFNYIIGCDISRMRYIKVDNSTFEMENSSFSEGCQIIARNESVIDLVGNTFENNDACPIIFYESDGHISYNNIQNNEGNGISISYNPYLGSVYVSHNTIQNNTGNGIYLYNVPVEIVDNEISYNGNSDMGGPANAIGVLALGNNGGANMGGNTIHDNYGVEILAPHEIFPNLTYEFDYWGPNVINDEYSPDGYNDNLDQYLIACAEYNGNPIDLQGNNFPNYNDPDFQTRFLPSFDAYLFDGNKPPERVLYEEGMAEVSDSLYDAAKLTMKEILSDYPETETAKYALQWLTYLEKFSGQDYIGLRDYIESIDEISYPNLEDTKYNTITSTYIEEEAYQTAITRLEDIISNPPSINDSIYAFIDQGYCYRKLDEQGGKLNVEKCSFKPQSDKEFAYVSQNLTQNLLNNSLNIPEPDTSHSEDIKFSLLQNYPNPTSLSTNISFSIPRNTKNASLKIYNIKGQMVKELKISNKTGSRNVIWNGKNQNGREVASGIYFYKLTVDKKETIKKMVRMK